MTKRTIATYHLVRKERVLARIYDKAKDGDDIHVLNIRMANRLENWVEVNALQRGASVVM